MSVRRVLRFFLGVILSGILMAIILPFAGIPSSHFLPPAFPYHNAQGVTRGVVVGKYYTETGNPFKIGGKDYFLDYKFEAPTPPPRGSVVPGPKQIFPGTIRITKEVYKQFANPQFTGHSRPPAKQVIPLAPTPERVKYVTSYPDINGIDAPWAMAYQGGRSIGPGSNVSSGWIMYLVAAIVLGYFMAMLLSHFMKEEEI